MSPDKMVSRLCRTTLFEHSSTQPTSPLAVSVENNEILHSSLDSGLQIEVMLGQQMVMKTTWGGKLQRAQETSQLVLAGVGLVKGRCLFTDRV